MGWSLLNPLGETTTRVKADGLSVPLWQFGKSIGSDCSQSGHKIPEGATVSMLLLSLELSTVDLPGLSKWLTSAQPLRAWLPLRE